MRTAITIAILLGSIGTASAGAVHHRHSHHLPPPVSEDCDDCNPPFTEYRVYRGYSGPDGYRVWEGNIDPSPGFEPYGENGGTVHYGY